ncbi:MAG: ATP-binding protein [Phormidesmis sp.]
MNHFSSSHAIPSQTADSTINAETFLCQVPGTRDYSILIIEDSEVDRSTYRRYLSKSGLGECSVILEHECAEEGLELCKKTPPDLILLDYLLPDMDGLEFLQALEDLKLPALSVPPVIMLTGQGDEKIAVEAMKRGARDYLVKGELNTEQLYKSIQRVLSQQALQRLVARQQRQQTLMASLAVRINQTSDLDSILQTATEGLREMLDCDRSIICQFDAEMNSTVVAESVLPDWTASLGQDVQDTCFQANGAVQYLQGHKTSIADVHTSNLSACHLKMLERFEVKANLVVPIILNPGGPIRTRSLWGLLIAHQCRSPREWMEDELRLMDELAVQFAIAIRQAEFITQLESRAKALSDSNHKLAKTARLLKKRNRELDEFAYVASHDLKAPLRAITNLSEWLEEDLAGNISEDSQSYLTLIKSRADRLDRFIQGLLNYSRAGRENVEATDVKTQPFIQEILDNLLIPETLTLTQTGPSLTLHTQQILLQQVLTNLISNAIKYHDKPNGTVAITVEDTSPFVTFSVTDDGPGIDSQHHQQIFGVFQTLNSKDDIDSTGIGLSIVKKLVETQGGKISLQSAPGEGSTFTFSWPQRYDPKAEH